MDIVLQKYISQSGYCSRRQAELFIRNGKVFVNGKKAELGMKVSSRDEVIIKGKIIKNNNSKIYIMLNKPEGVVCTNRKFKGEKNIFDLVKIEERLFCVGRLDKNSSGLVLLTNDGDLTQKLTHPSFGHKKEYVVKLNGKSNQVKTDEIINNFKKGIDIGDGDGVVRAKSIDYLGDAKFKIILAQGKKRQIRRMFKALGFDVEDLKRVNLGNLELGELREGEWRELSETEIRKLLNILSSLS